MSSQSTSDGSMTLDVTFKLGTNLDIATGPGSEQGCNRRTAAPGGGSKPGVTTKKKSPNLMMVINLFSPDNTYDQAYISNYAFLQIRDVLNRVEGVGDVVVLGAREYSMRVWLDPDRMWSRQLTTDDVVSAIQAQNVAVAAGRLGSEPAPPGTELELSVNTAGRLITPEQFRQILLKHGDRGELVYLGDVARVELGARDYSVGFLPGRQTLPGPYHLPNPGRQRGGYRPPGIGRHGRAGQAFSKGPAVCDRFTTPPRSSNSRSRPSSTP